MMCDRVCLCWEQHAGVLSSGPLRLQGVLRAQLCMRSRGDSHLLKSDHVLRLAKLQDVIVPRSSYV
jgi:hypothetical protein